jgi:hypothetical protein
MIDPITTGMVCIALVMLALIGKGWSAQSGTSRIEAARIETTTRLEVAKIEAQKRADDMDKDLSLALEHSEEARTSAREALDLAKRFDSRLSAAENRGRR